MPEPKLVQAHNLMCSQAWKVNNHVNFPKDAKEKYNQVRDKTHKAGKQMN